MALSDGVDTNTGRRRHNKKPRARVRQGAMDSTRFPTPPWPGFYELHTKANIVLKEAMISERARRWKRVIQSYKILLEMVRRDNLPEDYNPPTGYKVLLFESFYHMGLAQQHIGAYGDAVKSFTRALDAISLPKDGCGRCRQNMCLMTPVLCRRAMANSQYGDLKSAIMDVEKAIVLDNKSPDVHCVRALVRTTRGEENLAMRDVKVAMRQNAEHVCALILRGNLEKPLVSFDWPDEDETPEIRKEHVKAMDLHSDSQHFLHITDFKSKKIMDFYDRFLYSLNVPHTITLINLAPEKPTRKSLENEPGIYISQSMTYHRRGPTSLRKPFRCGTPNAYDFGKTNLRLRKEYGDALREKVKKPSTAPEFFEELRKSYADRSRNLSSRRGSETESALSEIPEFGENAKPKYLHLPPPQIRAPYQNRWMPKRLLPIQSSDGWSTPAASVKKEKQFIVQVFQPINPKNAPRLYYKPWEGDRIQRIEISKRASNRIPFYPPYREPSMA